MYKVYLWSRCFTYIAHAKSVYILQTFQTTQYTIKMAMILPLCFSMIMKSWSWVELWLEHGISFPQSIRIWWCIVGPLSSKRRPFEHDGLAQPTYISGWCEGILDEEHGLGVAVVICQSYCSCWTLWVICWVGVIHILVMVSVIIFFTIYLSSVFYDFFLHLSFSTCPPLLKDTHIGQSIYRSGWLIFSCT